MILRWIKLNAQAQLFLMLMLVYPSDLHACSTPCSDFAMRVAPVRAIIMVTLQTIHGFTAQ